MSFGLMMAMAMDDSVAMVNPMFTLDPFVAVDFQIAVEAIAGIQINLNGDIQRFTSIGLGPVIGTWDGGGTFVRADYDFRADKTSGTGILAGPFLQSVWYPGTGLIDFKVSTMAIQNWFGTLRMRPTGGGSDIDTAPDMNLSAESS